MTKTTFVVAVLALFSLPAMAQIDLRGKMKEGKYRTTSKTEIPGMPAGMGPMTNTMETCTTKEELEKSKGDMFRDPKSGKKDSSCEIKNVKSGSNTMSYDMVCPKEGMHMNTNLTFAGDTVKGVSKMKMTGENGRKMPPGMQEITSTFESKYLGPCSK
jgi:Protein of unknown function (DUF3617)